jgi:branched-chain amino acid transport system ATP-binding protein
MDFGGIRAVDRMDLSIGQGEIVALIGPNGAGKTTLFNCITGFYRPTSGTILLNTQRDSNKMIVGLKINRITELGMARTFQNIRLFPYMTVLENVMIGRHCRTKAGILGAILRDSKTIKEENDTVTVSYHVLKRIGLEEYANQLACNLPYGAQRRLEIARAMATKPRMLLLDEPAAGMNPQETKDLENLLLRIRNEDNISILLIEHDMKLIMSLSERVVVMDYGKKIADGTPSEIRKNPQVIKAYLGETY